MWLRENGPQSYAMYRSGRNAPSVSSQRWFVTGRRTAGTGRMRLTVGQVWGAGFAMGRYKRRFNHAFN